MAVPEEGLPANIYKDLPGLTVTNNARRGKALAGASRLLQHLRKLLTLKVALVESDAAFPYDAGDNTWFGRARADRTNAAVTIRDAVDLWAHFRSSQKRVPAFVHRGAAGVRGLPEKGNRVPLNTKSPQD